MSLLVAIGVGLLGGIGSVGRSLLDDAVSKRVGGPFPYGTLAVNLSGSFAIGLVVGVAPGPDAVRLLGVGLAGGYTTFSAWMLESQRLAEAGQRAQAAANLVVSLALGLGAVWLGRELGMAL